ncbi:MAG: hypothetical protein QOJ86_1069 [Bradyrhizobium sp.]|jgi:uncharacterized protein YjiS (DUF1127 family)|nr:hypothetical protein [Bradyrhizobium sp.]
MSVTLSTARRPEAIRSSSAYIWRLMHALAGDIARYFDRRAALKRLGELNDRELRDIGLTRGEIEAAVYGVMTPPGQGRMR